MRRLTRTASRDAGYTLLELLVALAIVSVVTSLTYASWHGRRSDERLDVIADKLRLALIDTRTEASRSAAPQTLVVDLDKREWRSASGERGSIPAAIDVTVTTVKGEAPGHEAEFRFMPEGSSTGGTIKLAEGQDIILVTVDWLTGRIAVGKPND